MESRSLESAICLPPVSPSPPVECGRDWAALLKRFQGDIAFSLGTVLTSIVAFMGSVIAARYLRPAELGVMQTLMLIPTYCSFLHFGVFNGLNRNIALFLGKGDRNKVQRMVDSSWQTAKAVAVLGFAISAAAFVCYFLNGSPRLYLWGMTFVLLALVAEPFSLHLEVVYLSSRSFKPLGIRLLWQNLATFVGNFLPAVTGVLGFIGARSVYTLSRLAVRWWGVPIRARGPGSLVETRELAATGMPLLIAGTLYAYLGAADRSVIACFMTPADVGHYALAGLVVTGIQFVPFCLATLMYPRVAACYGRTGSTRQLRRYFWVLLGLNVAAVLPMCLVTYLLIGPVTEHYLPAYRDGIPAAKLACLSSLGFIYIGVACIIAVIRRNTPYILAIFAALVLVWLLGGYWVQHGYGITGAVWARAIATTVLCIFTIGFAYWLTGREIAA